MKLREWARQAGRGLRGQKDQIRFLANSGLVLIFWLRQVTAGRVTIRNQGKDCGPKQTWVLASLYFRS